MKLQLKHLDKIDIYLITLIFAWVVMLAAVSLNQFTLFWWCFGFNIIFTPYTGVLLHNSMK